MIIEIDPQTKVPIYAQIEEQVRALIAAGQLDAGAQLPTIRELATDLGVNYNTVARAYGELDREGVIVTQQGKGSFVPVGDEHEAAKKRQGKLEAVAAGAVEEARGLGYSPSEFAAAVVKAITHWRQEVDELAH